jgi:hypothetical protein
VADAPHVQAREARSVMCVCGTCRTCRNRAYNRHWRQKPGYRVVLARYRASKKHQAVKHRHNRQRIFAGGTYVGFAPADRVEAIKAHVAERLRQFKEQSACRSVATHGKNAS